MKAFALLKKIETAAAIEPKKDDTAQVESQKDALKAEIKAEKKLENNPEKK